MNVGQNVFGYELLATLGTGASGTVWKARGPSGICALKVLSPHLARPKPAGYPGLWIVDRFLEEARILQKISHPGLARVLEVVARPDQGFVALALEFFEGRDLASLAPSLGLDEILEVMAATADILGVLHAHGIIHRDVKPANVFVAEGIGPLRDRVRLLDLGVAKDLEGGPKDGTAHGALVGTLLAMPPEAIRRSYGEKIALDGAVDQWALGVTLYMCVSDRVPFPAKDKLATVTQILTAPHDPLVMLTRFGGERAREIAAIVDRALAKEPKARFPDAGALSRALRAVAATLPGGRAPDAPARPMAKTPSEDPTEVGGVPTALRLGTAPALAQILASTDEMPVVREEPETIPPDVRRPDSVAHPKVPFVEDESGDWNMARKPDKTLWVVLAVLAVAILVILGLRK